MEKINSGKKMNSNMPCETALAKVPANETSRIYRIFHFSTYIKNIIAVSKATLSAFNVLLMTYKQILGMLMFKSSFI